MPGCHAHRMAETCSTIQGITSGRPQSSSVTMWVSDSDSVGWAVDPRDKRMDLVVDQDEYRPGDVANGHVLGSDNQWHPLAASTSTIPTAISDQPVSAAQTGHDAGDSSESKNRKMILWGAGGIAGIVLLGVI